jgi:hypothetical protein
MKSTMDNNFFQSSVSIVSRGWTPSDLCLGNVSNGLHRTEYIIFTSCRTNALASYSIARTARSNIRKCPTNHRHDCRYLAHRLLSHTGFKSIQVCVTIRCHVFHSFRPHLSIKEGSGAVTCPVTSDSPHY